MVWMWTTYGRGKGCVNGRISEREYACRTKARGGWKVGCEYICYAEYEIIYVEAVTSFPPLLRPPPLPLPLLPSSPSHLYVVPHRVTCNNKIVLSFFLSSPSHLYVVPHRVGGVQPTPFRPDPLVATQEHSSRRCCIPERDKPLNHMKVRATV